MIDINYIRNHFEKKCKDYCQSLFIISSEMIINKNISMIKFDEGIVKNNNKRLGKNSYLSAVDALDFKGDYLYFIEFKNGKMNNK
jgi:hypothetical protein